MNWFEKEYEKRFKNASSKDGVDEQQLWENIIKSPEMNKTPKNRNWLGLLFGICFLGMSLILIIFLKPNVDRQQNRESENISSISNSDDKSESKILKQEQSIISENKELSNSKKIENNQSQKLYNSKNELNNNSAIQNAIPLNEDESTKRFNRQKEASQTETLRTNKTDEDLNIQQANNSTDSKLIEVEESNVNFESSKLDKNHTQPQAKNSSNGNLANPQNRTTDNSQNVSQKNSNTQLPSTQVKEVNRENKNNEDKAIINPSQKSIDNERVLLKTKANKSVWEQNLTILPSTELNAITGDSQSIDLDGLNLYLPTQPLKQIKKKAFSILPQTIDFTIGTSLHNQNFNNVSNNQEFSNLLQNALNLELGKSVGLQFRWPLSNSIYINSGIQWTQTENRFEFMSETDTTVQRSNGSLIPAVNFRNVRHHNKYEVLSIPLELGYQKHIKSFGLGISFGLAYNFELKEDGKILNQNEEIISYTDGLYNNNFISVRIKPSIAYQFSERFVLNASLLGSYQSHKSSDLIGQKFNSIWWTPSIGISLSY